jgi:protoporphyrinogen oxidase
MPDVMIVGAGLAGLSCALELQRQRIDYELWEASDRVGGRLRTESVDGFLLDHGFQVLLTAYPTCKQLLDYDALMLGRFEPGAWIRTAQGFDQLYDPWRRPTKLLSTLLAGAGSMADKYKIRTLRAISCRGSLEDLYQRPQQTTLERLQAIGFSTRMIERFLRPYLGGIFLDRSLQTSSRMLEFVMRMFAIGDAALPAEGMQAIGMQLANRLAPSQIHLHRTAQRAASGVVVDSKGVTHRAKHVVVATEAPAAAKLTGRNLPTQSRSTTSLYFAAATAPMVDRALILAGEERGPINHVAVVSNVQPAYAPAGMSLVSVNLVDWEGEPMQAESAVRTQLRSWFGEPVDGWRHLRTFHIPYALPTQSMEQMQIVFKPQTLEPGLHVCGDWCETASIEGALHSGQRVAQTILAALN